MAAVQIGGGIRWEGCGDTGREHSALLEGKAPVHKCELPENHARGHDVDGLNARLLHLHMVLSSLDDEDGVVVAALLNHRLPRRPSSHLGGGAGGLG